MPHEKEALRYCTKKQRFGAYRAASEKYLTGHLTRKEAADRRHMSTSMFDRRVRKDAQNVSASGK